MKIMPKFNNCYGRNWNWKIKSNYFLKFHKKKFKWNKNHTKKFSTRNDSSALVGAKKNSPKFHCFIIFTKIIKLFQKPEKKIIKTFLEIFFCFLTDQKINKNDSKIYYLLPTLPVSQNCADFCTILRFLHLKRTFIFEKTTKICTLLR
jgi:hypothetical protein